MRSEARSSSGEANRCAPPTEEAHFPTHSIPQGGKAQGALETTWDLDKFFLVSKYHSTSPALVYDSRALATYDANQACYRSWAFHSLGLIRVSTGKWEGENLVFDGAFEFMGMKIKQKITHTKLSPTQIRIILEQDGGQGFGKIVEATNTRQEIR